MQMLRKYSNRWMLLIISIFFITFSAQAGNGGGQVKAMAGLDGSRHPIRVDSSRTVEDSTFFDPAYTNNIDPSYSVQNEVTLMINEASTLYLRSSFSVTV